MISAEQARRRAALVIVRIKAGEEPVPLPLAVKAVGGPTVVDLAARYLEEHVAVHVKPRTAVKARIALRREILPALGQVPLLAVERAQVVDLQRKMSGTPSAANTAVKTLSHMYRLAAGWGMVPEGCNPYRSVARFPERKRERFLTNAEFARLGRVLDEAVAQGGATPASVAVIRLLSLTGCRKNEILTLRWEDVDLDAHELHLADAKTGPRTVQLPPMAVRILKNLPRRADSPWVFPGRDPERHLSTVNHLWLEVRARAGLEDVRLHDLRHYSGRRIIPDSGREPADHGLFGPSFP